MMNRVFVNSLEKQVQRGLIRAQVSIAEELGTWVVEWHEFDVDGSSMYEKWYEGDLWDEMLAAFRQEIFAKQCAGFKPVLDHSLVPEVDLLDARTTNVVMLAYYSEEHFRSELFERLRKWRYEEASKLGKPLYQVASNRMLRMMSAFLPHTLDELQQLPGFGAGKVKQFGEALMDITREYERSTSFPLTWVKEQVDRVELNSWLEAQKQHKRQQEQVKLEAKRVLLEAVMRGDTIEQIREQTGRNRRDVVLAIEELDREGYAIEPYIEKMLQRVDLGQRGRAWDAFEQLGDRYLKPVLQSIYKREELSNEEADTVYEWLRLLRIQFRHYMEAQQAHGMEAG